MRARFTAETGLLVVVAAAAALAELRPLWTIALLLVAWVLVALIERASSRAQARGRGDVQETEARPMQADGPAKASEDQPTVVEVEPVAPEVVRLELPLAEPQLDPHSAESEPPDLPEPPAGEWNIWDLERLARARAGEASRDEEWTALFLNLRQFATADGVLPKEFDDLVRESFSELIQAA